MGRMFERKDTRKFEIKPRYWDPEKEEREEREKRVKAELGIDEKDRETYIPHIQGRFTQMYRERKENRRGYNGKYTVRLFLILIIIFIVALFVINRYSEGVFRFFGM